jgi:pantothenate kinase
MHPMLEKYYDFSIYLNITPELQKTRILKRNSPHFAKRFFEEWIPLENKYFSETNIEKRCNLVINII